MPQSVNHEYNVPEKGDPNWHRPLNENFRTFDTDIEIRDTDGNQSDYEPMAGTKFFAIDTGNVYVGDGSGWNHVPDTGQEPRLSAINPDAGALGVGTADPETKFHVADDPATTGALDLSRMTAVIENTSGESNGDVLGLKTQVSDPGQNVDFLSFLGDGQQLGQLNGDGEGGLRMAATNSLTLAADGRDLNLTRDNDKLVPESPDAELEVLADRALSAGSAPLYITSDTADEVQLRHGGSGDNVLWDDDSFNLYGSDFNVHIGNKNFVQPVDTPEGEKEVVYTSTEAPTARTEVSGLAELADGRAEIDLPEHFAWVTDETAPIHVQTTPYGGSAGLKVTERSTDRIVVADLDGTGEYEFAYTVRGTRDGHADKQIVREPTDSSADSGAAPASADD